MPAHRNLGFCTEDGLLKFQREILAQVGAALGPGAAAPSSAENIAKTKKLSKDVGQVLERAGIEAGTGSGASDTSMAKAVVHGTLLGVAQDSVGFAGFLEFLFRIRVVRVAVGVILHRQLAIGA